MSVHPEIFRGVSSYRTYVTPTCGQSSGVL